MKVLIIGQGGREHALAWKAAQSPKVTQVWVAPGNAGTEQEPKVNNIAIAATDIERLLTFAKKHTIDLTIVGPEAALAAGIVDLFNQHHCPCFGPTQAAAQLETSKSFSKAFMQTHRIPTANYATFTDSKAAVDYLQQQEFPIVIKADGLAAGKGVVIANNLEEAQATTKAMLDQNAFGKASAKVVIEDFLTGTELSFIVMVDGEHSLPLASSQDHKRRDNHDQGPNTGGMGAYSPAPQLNDTLFKTIMEDIIQPTVAGLQKNNTPYTGFLYAGLMIDPNGKPKVLEFNCRMGDPETQPILMRLQSDLVELCLLALQGKLNKATVQWDPRPALSVVLTAGGYPAQYNQGDIITGLDNAIKTNCKVFHAGTKTHHGNVITNGGRVLTATALGKNITEAQTRAYELASHITWKNCYYRTDIGYQAL